MAHLSLWFNLDVCNNILMTYSSFNFIERFIAFHFEINMEKPKV